MKNFKIKNVTICLHCGCNQSIVDFQMQELNALKDNYNITWNNRIDRYPKAYKSYSDLINDSVVTSKDEFLILVNDRATPHAHQAIKMLNHLEEGFACSLMYNVGYMAFSKELFRVIGGWDTRFLNGGWEDRDWVFRIAEANLKLYESQEGTYDYSWKSPLQENDRCAKSEPHFRKKWSVTDSFVARNISEQNEDSFDLGDRRLDISSNWGEWSDSILGIDYDKPNSGPPGSAWINGKTFTSYL
tara:strand:+ start:4263 stop:4994 length:732 start_codon:yes stop_codon:yes gene_type:complete